MNCGIENSRFLLGWFERRFYRSLTVPQGPACPSTTRGQRLSFRVEPPSSEQRCYVRTSTKLQQARDNFPSSSGLRKPQAGRRSSQGSPDLSPRTPPAMGYTLQLQLCVTYATDLPCSRPASHGTWAFTAGGMCAHVCIHEAVDCHTGRGSPIQELVDTASRRIVARCTHMLAYDLPRLPSVHVPRTDNLPLLDWARGACKMLFSAPEPRTMFSFPACLSHPLSAASGNDSPASKMFLACPQFSTQYLRCKGFSWPLLCWS